jgi:hypothetical protein
MKDAGLQARRTRLPGRFFCVLLPEPGRSYTPRATDSADRKRRRPRFRRVDPGAGAVAARRSSASTRPVPRRSPSIAPPPRPRPDRARGARPIPKSPALKPMGSNGRLRPSSPRVGHLGRALASGKFGPIPTFPRNSQARSHRSHLVELAGRFWDKIGQARRRSGDLDYEGEASRYRWLRAPATTDIDPQDKPRYKPCRVTARLTFGSLLQGSKEGPRRLRL